MEKFKITNKDLINKKHKNRMIPALKREKFEQFNESILGLGDIQTKPKKIEALSVIFDLEGFTTFCNQRDPELSVSLFLSKFLKWIFNEIKTVQVFKEFDDSYFLFANLPFLSKYLGDGLLLLWNTFGMSDVEINNSIVLMDKIRENYVKDFYPNISKKMVDAPPKLRCGIAKGTVFSVGNGNDYVGSCINVSARLQKFYNFSFCCSLLGIDFSKFVDTTQKVLIQKKVNIRGIGDEIICILKKEFESLSDEDKREFIDI